MSPTPEQTAWQEIDRLLTAAGWSVQDAREANLYAARDVTLYDYPPNTDAQADDYRHEYLNNAGVIVGIGREKQHCGDGYPETHLLPAALQSLRFRRNAETHHG
jgi:hypothetical protein